MQVLVADDQAEIRTALKLLIEQEPGFGVVGEVADADVLMSRIRATQPDLLMLDWELSGLRSIDSCIDSGRRLISALRALCPGLRVLAMSGQPEARRKALAAGADAFASKGDPPELLLCTLRHLGSRAGGNTIRPEEDH